MKKKKQPNKIKGPPTYVRNIGVMKLLVSDTGFKQHLIEIRKQLEIPEQGFIRSANKDYQEWYKNKFEGKSDQILSQKNFTQQEIHIKHSLRLSQIDRKQATEQLGCLYNQVPINYLSNEVRYILKKFNLPIHYADYIRKYILLNIVEAPSHNYVIIVDHLKNFNPPIREVRFAVYAKLTKDEKKELMREVEKFGELLPAYKPLKNIDRDLEIEESYNNREREDVVEMETYFVTSKEIAEDILGSKRKGKQVHDSVRHLKKLRNNRFNRSELSGPQNSE